VEHLYERMRQRLELPDMVFFKRNRMDFYEKDRDRLAKLATPRARFLWFVHGSGTSLARLAVSEGEAAAGRTVLTWLERQGQPDAKVFLVQSDGVREISRRTAALLLKEPLEYEIRPAGPSGRIEHHGQPVADYVFQWCRRPDGMAASVTFVDTAAPLPAACMHERLVALHHLGEDVVRLGSGSNLTPIDGIYYGRDGVPLAEYIATFNPLASFRGRLDRASGAAAEIDSVVIEHEQEAWPPREGRMRAA
jgi:hypothetical protein